MSTTTIGARRRIHDIAAPLALLALVVGGWEAAVRANHTPAYLFPAPSAVARGLVDDAGTLAHATGVTAVEAAAGFGAALAGAVAIAVAMHFSPALRRALLPLLVLSQTIPTVVFAPLLTIALGYALAPKIATVAIVCFFPVVVSTAAGLDATDPARRELMRSLGATRAQVFARLEVPSALPQAFSGARVAATYAAVGAVFAEWSGSSAGLGFVMRQAEPELDTVLIFAAVVVLCAIALALYGVVVATERLVVVVPRA